VEEIMKIRKRTLAIGLALFVELGLPIKLATQQQPQQAPGQKYVFTRVPTFGGPNTSANQTGAKNNLLNAVGTLTGGADTTIPDPYCPGSPDCFASHAFTFRHGALRDLGVLPGGFNSEAFWINDSGMAAGFSEIGVIDPLIPNFLELRGVLWRNGKAIEIGTFGGNDSMAQAVNNRGQVVGFALNDVPDSMAPLPWPTEMRAFLWDNGVLKNLGTLGGPDSWAFFVNDRGQVVGLSYPDSGTSSGCDTPGNNHVFVWENGQMQDIGTLGGSCSWPEGLSEQGRIVGWSNLSGDSITHPFLWERGTLKDLGTLGGSCGFATWVNDTGEVVGGACTEGDEGFVAFAWKDGVMTSLPPLPGDCFSIAKRNNSRGQIVGTSLSCDGSLAEGVLWENGTVTDLNSFVTPGSDLFLFGDVLYLNNRGEIAGNGILPNGDVRFFTLTPTGGNSAKRESAAIQSSHQHLRNLANGKLTPGVLGKLRSQFNPRHHISGFHEAKNGNRICGTNMSVPGCLLHKEEL
jgi:probable HAF family extracellular repeat protein